MSGTFRLFPRSKSRRRLTPRACLVNGFQYFTLLLMSALILSPLAITVLTSLKKPLEQLNSTPLEMPQSWTYFQNYVEFFTKQPVGLSFLNTAIVMLLSLTTVSVIGTMAAYVLDRFRFPGRSLVLLAYLMVMAIPAVTTQVATYRVILGLGLVGTKWALVALYSGADVVSLYIFLQYIATIPRELDESARMEGAGYFTVFRKVIFPLMGPAISTVLILRSIYIYNDFVYPYLYTPKAEQSTISILLYAASDAMASDSETILMAGIMIVTIPALLIFFALQKRIIAGVTRGAVKG